MEGLIFGILQYYKQAGVMLFKEKERSARETKL